MPRLNELLLCHPRAGCSSLLRPCPQWRHTGSEQRRCPTRPQGRVRPPSRAILERTAAPRECKAVKRDAEGDGSVKLVGVMALLENRASSGPNGNPPFDLILYRRQGQNPRPFSGAFPSASPGNTVDRRLG